MNEVTAINRVQHDYSAAANKTSSRKPSLFVSNELTALAMPDHTASGLRTHTGHAR